MFKHSKKQLNGLWRVGSVLLLAGIMTLLAIFSTPVGHAAAKSRVAATPTVAELEQYAFDLVNNERAAAGLSLYTRDGAMDDAARTHSELWLTTGDCPAQGTWPAGHWCPGESDPITRIISAAGSCTSCAENVGSGYQDPTPDYYALILNVHQNFMAEGPCGCYNHYDNIMNPNFQKVGVGVAIDSNNIRITWDFVQP